MITNDYVNLRKATKRGYPKGHVSITRHMNVPVFEQGRVVLVGGVANKDADYTMDDVATLQEFMNAIWPDFQRSLYEATW